ncbi:replication protein A [Novosphingobium aquimarinum]|uniref:replication protein A n=1 Tax=Novosphingobium aquimarinum TaxID=2682494 RepID=UPI0012EC1730|nr:replication protein A [Novosphingobium aquimarinum]
MKAARSFEYKTRLERREKNPGARNGALGEVGLEVLAWLYEKVDYASGRLDPAIGTIAAGIGRSYSAVHEALCRLRIEGFLSWIRRSRPIEDPEPGGQQVEQVSNAYALLVPKVMNQWLVSLLRKPPVPACEEDRRKAEKQAYEAMLAGFSAQERHEATWNGDRLLGETLKRLAILVDQRDSLMGESGSTGETGGSY